MLIICPSLKSLMNLSFRAVLRHTVDSRDVSDDSFPIADAPTAFSSGNPQRAPQRNCHSCAPDPDIDGVRSAMGVECATMCFFGYSAAYFTTLTGVNARCR